MQRQMIRTRGRASLAIVTMGLVIFSAALACRAGIGVDQLSQEKTVLPGETYRGSVTLLNRDEEVQAVKIYLTDYLFFSDGSSIYCDAGSVERSNAEWITVSPRFLEVPPGGTSSVQYAVSVPNDESLTGSFWSLIMVEELVGAWPSGEHGDRSDETRAGVKQVLRYGIQMITHVGDTGVCTLRITDKMLTVTEDGRRVLLADIENTGERAQRPHVWVELYAESGSRIGPFKSDKRRLYPGTSARYMVDLSDAPTGSYQALVVVDNGDEHVFGAQYGLEF